MRPAIQDGSCCMAGGVVCYFYQYALRSAPSVMMPQLSDAFGLSTLGVASIVRSVLLRVFALQSCGRAQPWTAWATKGSRCRRGSWPRRTVVRYGQRGSVEPGQICCREPAVSSLWSVRSTSPPNIFLPSKAATLVGATQMFGMAGGRRGAVCRWTNDRGRACLGPFLDWSWVLPAWDWRAPFGLLAKREKRADKVGEIG